MPLQMGGLGPLTSPIRRRRGSGGGAAAPAGVSARSWAPAVWALSNPGETGPLTTPVKLPGVDTLPAGAAWNAGTRTVTVTAPVTLDGWDLRDAIVRLSAGSDGATISNSRFNAARDFFGVEGQTYAAANVTITRCLFDGEKKASGNAWIPFALNGANASVTRCRFLDLPSDAVTLRGSGEVRWNYFTAGGYLVGSHHDAIYVARTTGAILIADNLVDMRDPGDLPPNVLNNAFRAAGNSAPGILHDVLFTRNIILRSDSTAAFAVQVVAQPEPATSVRVIDNLWRMPSAYSIHPTMSADTVYVGNAHLDTLAAFEVQATAATAPAGGIDPPASYEFGPENAAATADNKAISIPAGAMRLPAPGNDWYQGMFVHISDQVAQSGGNEVIAQKGTTTTATGGNDAALYIGEATSGTNPLRPWLVMRNASNNWLVSGEQPAVSLEREEDYLLLWGQIGATPFYSCVRCRDGSVLFNIQGAANNGATSFYNNAGTPRWNNSTTFFESFTALGCAFGATGDKNGFSGALSDLFNVHATFANTAGLPDVAALQALATGSTVIAGTSGLRYYNRLAFGSLAADASGAVTTAATEAGIAASVVPRAGAPIRRPPALSMTRHRLADGVVLGTAPGQSARDIEVTGTWAAATGAPGAIQARLVRVSDGLALPGFDWTDLSDQRLAGGAFSGWLRNVPAGTGFRIETRMRRAPSIAFRSQARLAVGDVVMLLSQSQQQIQFIPAATPGAGSNSVLAPTDTTDRWLAVMRHIGGLADTGTGAFAPSNGPNGFVGLRRITGAGQIGDGVVAQAARMAALRNRPVALIDASKGGHHPYYYSADRTPQTVAAAFTPNGSSTGPFAGTLTPPNAPAGISLTPCVLAGSASFSVRFGGSTVTISDNGSGGLTGTNVATGTINYLTGAYSLTFSVVPDAIAVPANWTYVSDYIAGGSTAKASATGYGALGSGADGTGVVSDMLARLRRDGNRITAMQIHWSTSIAGRFFTTSEPAYATARDVDYWGQFETLRTRMLALFPAELTDALWVFGGGHREVPTSGTAETGDHIKYGQIRRAIRDGIASRAWARDGGDYHDLGVAAAGDTQSGPHQDYAAAQVIGERMGVAVAAALGTAVAPLGPRIVSAAFTDGTRTAIRVTCEMTAPGATALVTRDGSTTGIVGFYIGDTIATRPNSGFTAAITGPLEITITKSSGSWAVGASLGYAVGANVFSGTLAANKITDDASLQKVVYDNSPRTTLQSMPGMPLQPAWNIPVT